MRVLLAFAGGLDHRPPEGAVRDLLSRIGRSGSASLARCVVERRGEAVRIRREKRHAATARVCGSGRTERPYPFASAVPLQDLDVARQIERLCGLDPTPAPPATIVHNIID